MASRGNRERSGKWKPGQSGNPSGRPANPDVRKVREAAAAHTEAAIATLVSLMSSADRDSVRVTAAIALLDRAYGKPAQSIGEDPDNRFRSLADLIKAAAETETGGE